MKALVFLTDPGPCRTLPPTRRCCCATSAPCRWPSWTSTTRAARADDWIVLRTRLTGICGSDSKQVLMDFDDADDNPMTAFISFPQVLGHEVVATVEQVGPGGRRPRPRPAGGALPVASRCRPRGITPVCPPCERGRLQLLELPRRPAVAGHPHRQRHRGHRRLRRAAPRPPVAWCSPCPTTSPTRSPCWPIRGRSRSTPSPGTRRRPAAGGRVRRRRPRHHRHRHPHRRSTPASGWPPSPAGRPRPTWPGALGATVFAPEPRAELVEALADWSGAPLRRPWYGLPVAYPGHIDVVYDTIGSPRTVEAAIRVLAGSGTLVQLGVSSPGRFEWTPWYFKELRLVGSNAFGVEELRGRAQARHRALPRPAAGRAASTSPACSPTASVSTSGATRSPPSIDQGDTGAIKVAFDFR